jgi:hypothetical protein
MAHTFDKIGYVNHSSNTADCHSQRSPCAGCRPHTASTDLSIIRPSSTRPVFYHPCFSTPSPLLRPRSSSLSAMLHLSPTHHETSKQVSLHKTDSSVGLPKFLGFKFKPMQVNYSTQIKPRYWSLGFSISSLMSTLTTKRHKVLISNPRPHESPLEDQNPKKSSRSLSRRRKNRKPNKRQEKRQTKEKAKKSSNSKTPLKPQKKQRKSQTKKLPLKPKKKQRKAQTQKLPLNQTSANTPSASSPR